MSLPNLMQQINAALAHTWLNIRQACIVTYMGLLLCLSPSAFAENLARPQHSALHIPLQSVNDHSIIKLADLHGSTVLLSFFEPDCLWCYRQMTVFNQLSKRCQTIKPVVVGINGNDQDYRKLTRRAKITYPAVKSSTVFRQHFNEVVATPWTYVLSNNGHMLGYLRGYRSLEQLLELFDQQCQPSTE